MSMAAEQAERAWKLRHREILAHRWADMAVAVAMEQMRLDRADPELRPLRFAADVATLATTILIDELLTKDGAIATLRAERDAYKRQAEECLRVMPASFTIKTITREGEPE